LLDARASWTGTRAVLGYAVIVSLCDARVMPSATRSAQRIVRECAASELVSDEDHVPPISVSRA